MVKFFRHPAGVRRLFRSSGGSVLMEFVLVAPIYILLFGGTFWIGELFVAQHMRLNAMRSTAWSYGLRANRPDTAGITSLMKDNNKWTPDTTPQGLVSRVRYLANPSQSWAQVVGGKFGVWYEPPLWTEGWFLFGKNMFQAESGRMGRKLTGGGGTYDHVVVMRTKGGAHSSAIRNAWPEVGYLRSSNLIWTKVAGEAYPYDGQIYLSANSNDAFPPVNPQSKNYIRYRTLYGWSNHREGVFGVGAAVTTDIGNAIGDLVEGVRSIENILSPF